MDGISLQVFMSDLEKAYDGQNLNSTVLQYADFSTRQREEFRAGNGKNNCCIGGKSFEMFRHLCPFSHCRKGRLAAL